MVFSSILRIARAWLGQQTTTRPASQHTSPPLSSDEERPAPPTPSPPSSPFSPKALLDTPLSDAGDSIFSTVEQETPASVVSSVPSPFGSSKAAVSAIRPPLVRTTSYIPSSTIGTNEKPRDLLFSTSETRRDVTHAVPSSPSYTLQSPPPPIIQSHHETTQEGSGSPQRQRRRAPQITRTSHKNSENAPNRHTVREEAENNAITESPPRNLLDTHELGRYVDVYITANQRLFLPIEILNRIIPFNIYERLNKNSQRCGYTNKQRRKKSRRDTNEDKVDEEVDELSWCKVARRSKASLETLKKAMVKLALMVNWETEEELLCVIEALSNLIPLLFCKRHCEDASCTLGQYIRGKQELLAAQRTSLAKLQFNLWLGHITSHAVRSGSSATKPLAIPKKTPTFLIKHTASGFRVLEEKGRPLKLVVSFPWKTVRAKITGTTDFEKFLAPCTIGIPVESALLSMIRNPLTPVLEARTSKIYLFSAKLPQDGVEDEVIRRRGRDAGFVKIGVTEKVAAVRHKPISKCATPLLLSEDNMMEEILADNVPHCDRVEKLIHTELKDFRRCRGCNRAACPNGQHEEWFQVELGHARAVCKRWIDWIRRHPYVEIPAGHPSAGEWWLKHDLVSKEVLEMCRPISTRTEKVTRRGTYA